MTKKHYDTEMIYDSSDSYLAGSDDAPSWKIFLKIFESQGSPDKIVLVENNDDKTGFYDTKLILFKAGILSPSQYTNNTYPEFLSMLKRYRIVRSIPKRIDDRTIKVVDFKDATILHRILSRIDPAEKFRQERLDEKANEINRELKTLK